MTPTVRAQGALNRDSPVASQGDLRGSNKLRTAGFQSQPVSPGLGCRGVCMANSKPVTAIGPSNHWSGAVFTFPDARAARPLDPVENAPIVRADDAALSPRTVAFVMRSCRD